MKLKLSKDYRSEHSVGFWIVCFVASKIRDGWKSWWSIGPDDIGNTRTELVRKWSGTSCGNAALINVVTQCLNSTHVSSIFGKETGIVRTTSSAVVENALQRSPHRTGQFRCRYEIALLSVTRVAADRIEISMEFSSLSIIAVCLVVWTDR